MSPVVGFARLSFIYQANDLSCIFLRLVSLNAGRIDARHIPSLRDQLFAVACAPHPKVGMSARDWVISRCCCEIVLSCGSSFVPKTPSIFYAYNAQTLPDRAAPARQENASSETSSVPALALGLPQGRTTVMEISTLPADILIVHVADHTLRNHRYEAIVLDR